jgi:hypothetical protein
MASGHKYPTAASIDASGFGISALCVAADMRAVGFEPDTPHARAHV